MSELTPGWYKDPVEPTTQRYWDGEGWLGDPLPADAEPPPGPPPERPHTPPAPIPPAPGSTDRADRGSSPSSQVPPAPERRSSERRLGTLTAPGRTLPQQFPPGKPARPHGYALASPGARLLARLIDFGLLLLLNVAVNGWFAVQLWGELEPTLAEAWQRALAGDTSAEGVPPVGDQFANLLLAILFITTALWFAYEVPAIANTGQTIGKRVLGIKVVRLESADPLTFGRSFRRWNTMGIPVLLWPCFGIGFALQLVDALFVPFDRPLHQALHDKSAYTAVVTVDSHQEAPDEPANPS